MENRLRSAIGSGLFKPGQRLIERELCEQTGVGRTSIREALRQLEAEGLVTTIPHRGPIVSTITAEEADSSTICARCSKAMPVVNVRGCAIPRSSRGCASSSSGMGEVAGQEDRSDLLAAKTEFYAALLEGCGNVFVERFLKMLLNRVTVLRMTSMTQANRIGTQPDRNRDDSCRHRNRRRGRRRTRLRPAHSRMPPAVALDALSRENASRLTDIRTTSNSNHDTNKNVKRNARDDFSRHHSARQNRP